MANATTTTTTRTRTTFIEKLIDHLTFRDHLAQLGIYDPAAEEAALADMILERRDAQVTSNELSKAS